MPKVKFHKTENYFFGLSEISGKNKDLEEIDIELNSASSEQPIFKEIFIDEDADLEKLGIGFENLDQLKEIFENIGRILQDPSQVFKYLKNLDSALGQRAQELGLELKNNKPEYLICGAGNFVAGPWPENYQPLRKGKILHHELLKRENEAGLNLQGVPVFRGFVIHEEANKAVGDGNIFTEDEQVGRLILHGKYTHRLFFEIIREAEKAGDLKLEIDGRSLSQKQLLNAMISTWGTSSNHQASSWSLLIDFLRESEDRFDYSSEFSIRSSGLNPHDYCFSSRSPLVLKSLLTCFGHEEIPHLSSYLLDSHYKQIAQMVGKIKENSGSRLDEVPDQLIYTSCIDAITTGREFLPSEIKSDFDFLAQNKDNKYVEFAPNFDKNISRKREGTEGEIGKYESIGDYIRKKQTSSEPKSPITVTDFESVIGNSKVFNPSRVDMTYENSNKKSR